MSAVVQVFPKPVNNQQGGADQGDRDPGEYSAVFGLNNYLPSTDNEERNSGDGNNGGGDGNQAAQVLAALNAPTGQFESFVKDVTRLPQQPAMAIGSRATNAALWGGWVQGDYATENFFDVSRRVGWGDFRSYQRGGDKFMTLSGKPITFAEDDIGIELKVPYELVAEHTTVDQADYDAVWSNHRAAYINEGNPFAHRLGVYSLEGMALDSEFV
ncbi:MAG: hypothetical protein RIT81_31160 [Deltaproteobacteria bacterium]